MLFLKKTTRFRFFNIFKKTPKKETIEVKDSKNLNPIFENLKKQVISKRKNLEQKKSKKKLTVYLELEGIIYQSFTPHFNEGYIYQPKRKYDEYLEYKDNSENKMYLINLYLRPHYKEFLNYLKENTETILYTYTQKFYTDQILNKLGNENFDFIKDRFYQEDCGILKVEEDGLDDLVKIIDGNNRDEKKSVIIDNRFASQFFQPNNYMFMEDYNANKDIDMKDDSLKLGIDILKILEKSEDVRVVLKDLFEIEKIMKESNFI